MLLVLLFVPLVLITAVLIIGVFSMPAMVTHLAERSYPKLELRSGGTFAGSVWNSVAALVWLALLRAAVAAAVVVPAAMAGVARPAVRLSQPAGVSL